LRLIDFVYHPTLGLRVIKKKKHRVVEIATAAERGDAASAGGVLSASQLIPTDNSG